MKKMKFILIAFLFSITLNLMLASSVISANYGDDDTQKDNIVIDKTVGRPYRDSSGKIRYDFRDNLSPNDYLFAPQEIVKFQITFHNLSNMPITNAVFEDSVPEWLEPIKGPGSYDVRSRKITYVIPQIPANGQITYEIDMKIVSKIPDGIISQTNSVELRADPAIDQDSAQFYIDNRGGVYRGYDGNLYNKNEKIVTITDKNGNKGKTLTTKEKVELGIIPKTGGTTKEELLNVKKIPNTGPELGLLVLAGNLLGLGAGKYLKRRSK